jgi:hypothetical protein
MGGLGGRFVHKNDTTSSPAVKPGEGVIGHAPCSCHRQWPS